MITKQEVFIRKLIREQLENNIFYHGTTDLYIDEIKNDGLEFPYLTNLFSKAEYYAMVASEEYGGNPIVLQVLIPNKNKLLVDFNELDEPVIVDGMGNKDQVWKTIKQEYNTYAKNHPERYDKKYNLVDINPKDYWFSLKTVRSVRYDGNILKKYISII